jgi:hemin uptake protein HemP
MAEEHGCPDPSAEPTSEPISTRIVRAEDLFAGTREIWIDLAGVRYRLRITRRNRLILQK